MAAITSEADWLACGDPHEIVLHARGRVDPERFRWLAVEWGGRIRHLLTPFEQAYFDAVAAWVATGCGGRPDRPGDLWDHWDGFGTRTIGESTRQYTHEFDVAASRGDWLSAAVFACQSAGIDVPRHDPDYFDATKTHRGRSAAKRRAEAEQRQVYWAAWLAAREEQRVRVGREFCDQFRDVTGNPFHSVSFQPEWRTSDVLGLSTAVDVTGDFGILPILADALEEAGCTAVELLRHCREPGPHVRGCWAVDLVLGRT